MGPYYPALKPGVQVRVSSISGESFDGVMADLLPRRYWLVQGIPPVIENSSKLRMRARAPAKRLTRPSPKGAAMAVGTTTCL